MHPSGPTLEVHLQGAREGWWHGIGEGMVVIGRCAVGLQLQGSVFMCWTGQERVIFLGG